MIATDNPSGLKPKYLRAAAMTAAQLLRLLGQLRQDAGDIAALRLLVRRFHGLSAFGGAFGLAAVAVIAQIGEHDCATILRTRMAPDRAQLEQIRALVLQLRRVIARQRASDGGRREVLPSPPPPDPEAARASSPPLPPRRLALAVGLRDVDWATVASRLALHGFAVQTADTCKQAGRVFAGRLPEAVIAAADLPDGTGCLLAHYVRSLEGGDQPVVVIVQGPGGGCGPEELARCDADAAFETPVSWSAVAETLADALARRRSAPRILYLSQAPDPATAKLLDDAGYRVRCCPDPSRVARDLSSFDPALVMTDLPRSSATAGDLRRCLLGDKRYAAMPVLRLAPEPMPWRDGSTDGVDRLECSAEPAALLATVATRIERCRALKRMFAADLAG